MEPTESETGIDVKRNATTLEWSVTLGTRLDVYAATNLVAALQMMLREPGAIRINLNGCQRAHAAVVQVLVAVDGRSFALSGLSLELASTLQLAGLAEYLPFLGGEAQAML